MAKKRMFTIDIVDSDAFLEMPTSAQALYFHLNMRADDDGFVGNPKKIMRTVGAAEDDLKLLIAKSFLIIFENGVIVIKHWRMHNTLSAYRYHETNYVSEKDMLRLKRNGAYTLGEGQEIDDTYLIETSKRQTKDKQKTDSDVDIDIDVDVDKDVEEELKHVSDKSDTLSDRKSDYDVIKDMWNELDGIGNIKAIRGISGKRQDGVRARLKQYGIDGFREAIEHIKKSDFLQGNTRDAWTITFDWMIKPNNFPKVLEGNYDNKDTQPHIRSQQSSIDDWVARREREQNDNK